MAPPTGLENRRSGNVTVGSNPTLSANFCGFPGEVDAAQDAPFTSRSTSPDGAHVGTPESPASQGWLPWSGGVCPVDVHTVVEYRLRFQVADGMPLVSAAGNLRWDHGRTPESAANASLRRNDIVVYRIKEKRHHG